MKRTAKFIALTLIASVCATSAFAGGVSMDSSKSSPPMMTAPPDCGRWYVSAGGGTAFNVGGTLVDSVSKTIFLGPFPADYRGRERDFSDIYDNSVLLRGEVGYALWNRLDVFVKAEYEQANGGTDDDNTLTFSTLAGIPPIPGFPQLAPGPGGFTARFHRQFDDYERYGAELGLRYHFMPRESRWNVTLALSGGASNVSSIGYHSDISFGTFAFNVYDGPLYDDSIVFTGTATLGVEYQLTRCASIGIDAGVSYQSGLDGDDSGFNRQTRGILPIVGVNNLSFLNGSNESGDRLSIPVTVSAKIRF